MTLPPVSMTKKRMMVMPILTDEEQRGHDPAEHCVAEFVEDGGDDQRAAGEQLICDWVHELAQFGDLVIFAGHPTVELIGAGGDDER